MQKARIFIYIFFVTFFSGCGQEEVNPPKADFVFTSNNDFLAPTTISFENKSTDAKEYTWDFGDGSPVSSNINPIHVYDKTGKFSIVLIASNGNLIDQIIQEITVYKLPLADFTFTSNNSFKAPSTITFVNKSIDAETYQWDFEDGSTSTEVNPTHEYSQPGTYNIKLTCKNQKGSNTKTESITINPMLTEEGTQLGKLRSAWILQSANDSDDRTADFTDPDLVLTISGSFVQGGIYDYSFTGKRPNPSPWPVNGKWQFGTNKLTTIIRDPGTTSEIEMSYQVTDTNLTLTFTVPDGSEGWAGSRTSSVSGVWTFTFSK